ncbi:lytic transglycosylase domain-containing protein [Pseudochrobactrum sp. sp1633]|uniref:lytic transglycosylase domain-containing protein n=1 Tax=Pseudochrobactrum sp. sp1633 TaxID=3036706 RepID=UPI0025A5ED2B|nr:lytic transglycosylase domain-containing protein [Pseudochrobactrum sp. sp1633]MDM8344231.1 lytic transglycosylase domain-containing protein [Pseudochrobactrum sp. sp1633]HWD14636.1 lytic transglycosylase domain-containing protein [Pseudochrobactrum sp.]
MQISSLALRSALLLSGVVVLSACTTTNNPKTAANTASTQAVDMAVADMAKAVNTPETVAGVPNPDGSAKGAIIAAAAPADAAQVAGQTQVLALAATDVADPVLPAAVPLPMFRQTATEALLATATPSLATGAHNTPGEVKYTGVTKSGTANHLVEQRAEIAADSKPELHNLIGQYAAAYQVPERLVHRVVQRESRYNPVARNGPYFGLMQISHATARGMGYQGNAQGLLNANTNLRYAVKYLAGAYKVAGGNETQAVKFYARGYYYDAKRKGLLEETGLRTGPNSVRTAFIEPGKTTEAAKAVTAAATGNAVDVAQTDPMVTQSVAKSAKTAGKSSRVSFKPRENIQR